MTTAPRGMTARLTASTYRSRWLGSRRKWKSARSCQTSNVPSVSVFSTSPTIQRTVSALFANRDCARSIALREMSSTVSCRYPCSSRRSTSRESPPPTSMIRASGLGAAAMINSRESPGWLWNQLRLSLRLSRYTPSQWASWALGVQELTSGLVPGPDAAIGPRTARRHPCRRESAGAGTRGDRGGQLIL